MDKKGGELAVTMGHDHTIDAGDRLQCRPDGVRGPAPSTVITPCLRRLVSSSSSAIRPRAMIITRPQTASTSDRMCVERRIVCARPAPG